MVIGVVGWGSVWGRERGDWRGGRTSPMEDSIDVLLGGESLGAGIAVCGGVVNGLSLTVDLRDALSPMSFIDPPELLCSLTLCLPSVSGILGELFRDFNNGSWRLPSPPWNVKPSLDFSLWELRCGLIVLLWGVEDCVVIRTGSFQCMREGFSAVPQRYGFSHGGKKAVWGKLRLSQMRSSLEVELTKMS